jgi:pimeloyl-ACP methyl ester carboxylesterase
MKVLLIPGFWLDASSWNGVLPALRDAGHDVTALTLPGLESRDADRSSVTLQGTVDAVVAQIDAAGEPVVLVGHSGGGSIAYAAADARPDAVARIVYVDSFPLPEGGVINDELPAEGGEIPLPDWGLWSDEELAGFTDEIRADFAARAVPEPEAVATTPFAYTDTRRRAVPATIIATTMPESTYRAMMQPDHPWHSFVGEVMAAEQLDFIELPTSHWPQFTTPTELGEALVRAIR